MIKMATLEEIINIARACEKEDEIADKTQIMLQDEGSKRWNNLRDVIEEYIMESHLLQNIAWAKHKKDDWIGTDYLVVKFKNAPALYAFFKKLDEAYPLATFLEKEYGCKFDFKLIDVRAYFHVSHDGGEFVLQPTNYQTSIDKILKAFDLEKDDAILKQELKNTEKRAKEIRELLK
jgi:hypothetical protein